MSEKMTDEQVVARFNELVAAGRVDVCRKALEDWQQSADGWAWRLRPEPRRIPLTQADWAGGPWWVRVASDDEQKIWCYVMAVGPTGTIEIRDYKLTVKPQQLLTGFERSRDCITWEPCWKEGAGA